MPISIAAKAILGLVAIGTLGAYELAPPDPREQTLFLERLADRVDRAQTITPQTGQAFADMLVRIHRQQPRSGRSSDIEARRQIAIARLERSLQAKLSSAEVASSTLSQAQSSPVARK